MRHGARPTQGVRLFEWMRRWPLLLRRRAMWVGIGVFALVAGAIVLRQPIADRLWPEARYQQLRETAALALAQGRLTAPDGTGARELYEAALALDPDRSEARAGLQAVAQASLAQARSAMRQQRFGDAHRALRLARELAMPRAEVEAVAAQLRQREAAVAGIDGLLARAAAARRAGRLVAGDVGKDPLRQGPAGMDAALPLYQRVLQLQPERTEALEGREDALSDLLQRASDTMAKGDLRQAATTIGHAAEFDAGHVGLPDARAALSRATDARMDEAARALRRGRLAQAEAGYRAVLDARPDDGNAQAGLDAVAGAHARRSEQLAADFRFAEAQRSLQQAQALSPELPAVAQAARRVSQARQSRARLPTAQDSAGRTRRVRALLASAAEAEARGDLLTPPGDSAFDHLRTARALAPRDPDVQRASLRLLPAAQRCFDSELRANRLVRAKACLDARAQLGDTPLALRNAATRLSQRWLAVGEERLRAGELAAARRAEAEARGLDGNTEGLSDFATRLQAASAGRE